MSRSARTSPIDSAAGLARTTRSSASTTTPDGRRTASTSATPAGSVLAGQLTFSGAALFVLAELEGEDGAGTHEDADDSAEGGEPDVHGTDRRRRLAASPAGATP